MDTMTPVRILVVDDEPEMLRSVVRVLEGRYEVSSTTSPATALDLAREFVPHLAIVDIRMPEMDGFELMNLLQAQEQSIQVILMTGSVYDVDLQLIRALREQAFYYITKPFDREVLHALVQRCIEFQERQNQVIQSEKLASLGKLTAGVAHEISNPLNFVNNFSRLSLDMLKDMERELGYKKEMAPDLNWMIIDELLKDLAVLVGRIDKHGRRVSNIVRRMLDHANAQPGDPQPTSVHELIEQYLWLAYHGMQAQEESFSADLRRNYDERIGKADIVPSAFGRALFNLFSNAFYAVQDKQLESGPGYEPAVRIQTELIGEHIEVRIEDNGIGIAAKWRDKIFEPFFTTRPPGYGVGLGLSLAYEIVVNGHGGIISMESEEGSGATFRVVVPLNRAIV